MNDETYAIYNKDLRGYVMGMSYPKREIVCTNNPRIIEYFSTKQRAEIAMKEFGCDSSYEVVSVRIVH